MVNGDITKDIAIAGLVILGVTLILTGNTAFGLASIIGSIGIIALSVGKKAKKAISDSLDSLDAISKRGLP